MTFAPKNWHDLPDTSTPLSAAALMDLETRLSGYTDSSIVANSTIAAAPTGNATTDTATVISASANGQTLADGNYVCTQTGLQLAANTLLRIKGQGSGRTTITVPSNTDESANIIATGSATGGTYNLTVNAALGDTTLTVAASDALALGAVAGDYLHLWSNKVWTTTVSQGAVQGEIVRVKSVNTGTGVITIYGRLDDAYLTSDTARIRKLALLDGCYVEGVTIKNSTSGAGTGGLIHVGWTRGFRMRDVVCIGADRPGLQIDDSIDFDITLRVRDLNDNSGADEFGYGVLAFGSSRDGKIFVNAERCRHAFTTGGSHFSGYATNPQACGIPRHIDVAGVAWETTSNAWDTHSEAEDIRFWISAHGCYSPFQVRGKNCMLMSGDFRNCPNPAQIAYTGSGFRANAHLFRNCSSDWFVGDTSGNNLDDVQFFGYQSDTAGGSQFQNCSNVRFVDPVVTNPGGAGTGDAFFLGSGCNAGCLTLVNPTCKDAFRLINNNGAVTDAARVFGLPTLINVTKIATNGAVSTEDLSVESRRRATTFVNSGSAGRLVGFKRDDYNANRDAGDRLMIDSAGVLWGGDGTGTLDTQLFRRSTTQWGVVGEMRTLPTATNIAILSSKVTGDSASQRFQINGDGSYWFGDGTASTVQQFGRGGSGEFNVLNDLYASAGVQTPKSAPTYGTTVTPDRKAGNWALITVTNTTAFTIAAPSNAPFSSRTAELTIEVLNSSGGVMGAITWNATYLFPVGTWTNPANTKKRFAKFNWNGANWVCTSMATADY